MNFYKHYIGDFQRDTNHLSLTERGAYLALIHHYYATEKPLPNDHAALCRVAGAMTKQERDAVKTAMVFFEVVDSGLMHTRIECEIQKAGDISSANRDIALAREEKRRAMREHEACTKRGTSVTRTDHDQSTNQNQTPDIKEIPLTPKGVKSKRSAIEIKKFLETCKTNSEKPIPETDPVFQYAEDVGIPLEFLRLAWREFVDRHQEGQKRYTDWRRAFRNCVRANWYKLWWANDGGYQLTTVGIQAERKHIEAAA